MMIPTKMPSSPVEEVLALHDGDGHATMRGWLARGDGVACYENAALDSANCGHQIFLSFGSAAAQIEAELPPDAMPDVGRFPTPWAYRLKAWAR